MYEELVKDLRKEAEFLAATEPLRIKNAFAETMKQAADAIEKLPAKDTNAPNWIPVTERLPGTGEIVLVYGKRGGIYTAEHNRSGNWPGTFWKLNSKSHHCEPTHWMPLPGPPKEVDDGTT